MVYNQIWPINPMNNFYFLMEDDILIANKIPQKKLLLNCKPIEGPIF